MADPLEKIHSAKDARVSLAEVIREIDIVKEAFTRTNSMESRLNHQDQAIRDIKNQLNNFVHSGYFAIKLQDSESRTQQTIRESMGAFSEAYASMLDKKLTLAAVEPLLSQKATWAALQDVTLELQALRLSLEKHMAADFPNLKHTLLHKLQSVIDDIPDYIKDNSLKSEAMKLNETIKEMQDDIQRLKAQIEMSDSGELDSEEELDLIMDTLQKDVVNQQNEFKAPDARKLGKNKKGCPITPRQINKRVLALKTQIKEVKSETGQLQQIIESSKEEANTQEDNLKELEQKYEQLKNSFGSMKTAFNELLSRKTEELLHIQEREAVMTQQEFEKVRLEIKESFKQTIIVKKHLLTVEETALKSDKVNKDKLSELIHSLNGLAKTKDQLEHDLFTVSASLAQVEEVGKENYQKLNTVLLEIKNPMRDMLSNQQNQIKALSEELRRQQALVRNIFEEYQSTIETYKHNQSSQLSPPKSAKTSTKLQTPTPNTRKNDKNWVQSLGEKCNLPRFPLNRRHSVSGPRD